MGHDGSSVCRDEPVWVLRSSVMWRGKQALISSLAPILLL